MAIFKNCQASNFAMIPNSLLDDERLSWKAKGVLCYLLRLPHDWKVYSEEVATHSRDGIDSLNSAIKELIETGYIIREQIRDEQGQFKGYEYSVFNTPTETGKSKNGKTKNGKSKATNTNITKKERSNSSVIETPTSTSSQIEKEPEALSLEAVKTRKSKTSNNNKDAIEILEYYFNKEDTIESKESLGSSYYYSISLVNKILKLHSVENIKNVVDYIYNNRNSGNNKNFWRIMTIFSEKYFEQQALAYNSKKSASDTTQKTLLPKYYVVAKGRILEYADTNLLPAGTPFFTTRQEADDYLKNSTS